MKSHFRPSLAGQDHLDEVFVVDVSGRVLLAVDQRLGLLLGHLLAQRGEHVTELGAGDVAVAVLKEGKDDLLTKVRGFEDWPYMFKDMLSFCDSAPSRPSYLRPIENC